MPFNIFVILYKLLKCFFCPQVRRLESLVKDSESGLGSASTKINSLKDAHSRMQSELEKTREELKTHKNNAASYKVSRNLFISYMLIVYIIIHWEDTYMYTVHSNFYNAACTCTIFLVHIIFKLHSGPSTSLTEYNSDNFVSIWLSLLEDISQVIYPLSIIETHWYY